MSEQIVIILDLDSAEYNKSLKDIETSTDETAKKVGESLDKSIAQTLDKNIVTSANKATESLDGFGGTLLLVLTRATAFGYILYELEDQFGLLTRLGKRFGVNVEEISERFEDLKENILGLISGENTIMGLKFAIGSLLSELGLVNNKMVDFIITLGRVNDGLMSSGKAIAMVGGAGLALVPVYKNFERIQKLARGLAREAFFGKGLFGFTASLTTAGAALAAFGEGLGQLNNPIAGFMGSLIKLTGAIIGGLGVAIGWGIVKASQLGRMIGNNLTMKFQNASQAFIKAEKSLLVFGATVDAVRRSTELSRISTDDWLGTVDDIAKKFNLARDAVRKSAQEILLVAPKLGLVEGQMKKLLKVSAEYAKINGKDVFNTTVNFVNALNGNAQAVQAYGVKLGAVAVQQYSFSKGVTRSLASMSENEKVQTRFNKLLKEYKTVAGIATVASNSLADQQVRLELNQKRLMEAMGEGARIIEQNNIVALLYNQVLNRLPDSMLAVTGAFGALGARILSVGSLFVELYFKAYTAMKIFRLMDTFLKSEVGISTMAKKIPLLNRSFNEMISELTGVKTEIKSMDQVIKAFTDSTTKNLRKVFAVFKKGTEENAKAIAFLNASLAKLKVGLMKVWVVLAPLLIPMAKIALIVGVVVGALYGLYKIFAIIEKQTKVFSGTWKLLMNALNEGKSVFSPVIDVMKSMTDAVITLAVKGFGMLVSGATKVMSVFAELVKLNPFGTFSEETVSKVAEMQGRLDSFSAKLQLVGYDLRTLGGDLRNVAGESGNMGVNLEALVGKLQALRDEFKFFGMTDAEVIRAQEQEKLQSLQASFDNQLIAEEEFNDLRYKVKQDALNKINALEDKKAKERLRKLENNQKRAKSIIMNGFVNAISSGIQSVVKAMEDGVSEFDAFAGAVLGVFGQMAIQLGEFYVAQGLATMSMMSVDPTGTIMKGIGLIALGSILSGMAGRSGGGESSSGGGGGSGGGSGAIGGQRTELADPEEVERLAPQNNVEIVVQGSLVQQEELGVFITDTLNENFEKNGSVLTDARFV